MSVFHSNLFRQQALIAGSWRDAADGTTLAVSNPSTGATLGQIPNMGRAEAQQAVDAAAAALPGWRAFTAAQRAALLKNWHRLILENKTALAQIMTAEQGKPLAEAEGEIAYAASFIEWFAEQGKRANGEIIPSPGADKRLMVIRQGVGVCAAITPWNFPAAMITRKAGPALAAGCTMVIKPANETPFTALAMAELANQALDRNLNVMMFSDNVTLEDEIQLKTRAREKGLLVMGPDCGTSMIAATPLAFANVMPEGNIGVIGASGTGIQELCSQIALAGEGITHAIGLGGRDLSREVGGISALTALEMLSADEKSEVLAFVSKPPAEAVRLKIVNAMKATGKPTVALFLGYTPAVARDENVWFASSLDEAARLACLLSRVTARRNAIAPVSSGFICGLYTGGTLAAEAAGLLAGHLGVEADDTHHHGMMLDADGHQIIDLGDDFYTVGRPNPMIDPALRNQIIADLGAKPQVRVLLLDVVIGFGATADPAASLVSAWQKACAARSDSQPLYAIATVTGTERDPQCRSQQIATLEDAGIAVVSSLPEATLLAAALIHPLSSATQQHTPSLLENVAVINIGLRSFALELQSASKPVVHYQWSPVAGGNKKLARLLERLQ